MFLTPVIGCRMSLKTPLVAQEHKIPSDYITSVDKTKGKK